jgi:hypothetical protein
VWLELNTDLWGQNTYDCPYVKLRVLTVDTPDNSSKLMLLAILSIAARIDYAKTTKTTPVITSSILDFHSLKMLK